MVEFGVPYELKFTQTLLLPFAPFLIYNVHNPFSKVFVVWCINKF